MPILVTLIVLSLGVYLFYKIKSVRTRMPMEKKWISGKSSIALGAFVALFGINQLFLFHTTITYIIAAVFIFVGLFSIWGGYKMYKFYLPHAIEEAANQKDNRISIILFIFHDRSSNWQVNIALPTSLPWLNTSTSTFPNLRPTSRTRGWISSVLSIWTGLMK